MKTYSRTVRSICAPCCPVMYFPALLGARFLGQPRIPAVAAILIPVDCLGGAWEPVYQTPLTLFYFRDMLCMGHELSKANRRWNMAVGSSCWCRPVINLALNCGRYQLRLTSSESSKHTAKRGRYKSWLFWLLVGSGTAGLAAHNRLWERKQRRKLQVQIEGIGRFFRSVRITLEVLSPAAICVKMVCADVTCVGNWNSSHLLAILENNWLTSAEPHKFILHTCFDILVQ